MSLSLTLEADIMRWDGTLFSNVSQCATVKTLSHRQFRTQLGHMTGPLADETKLRSFGGTVISDVARLTAIVTGGRLRSFLTFLRDMAFGVAIKTSRLG